MPGTSIPASSARSPRLGAELRGLGAGILGTRLPARVALVFSWPNWWNVEYRPGPSSALDYVEEVQRYYRPLWERNIAVDVVPPDRDLSGYDLVIAPLLNMVSAEQGAALDALCGERRHLPDDLLQRRGRRERPRLAGGLSGAVTPDAGHLGRRIRPADPRHAQSRWWCRRAAGLPAGSYECDLWCDLVHLEGARALATYGDDFYAGRPAITEHRFGQGPRALRRHPARSPR